MTGGISLVVSDVDGTLVTADKTLTPAVQAAVARLHERGIRFSIVSSRPPFGMRMLIEPLALAMPFGAFNGGLMAMPDLSVVETHVIPPAVARQAIDTFRARGIDAWAFTADRWLVEKGARSHIDKERHTIATEPTVVARLDAHLEGIGKLVGVSDDPALLSSCAPALRAALGGKATIVQSQPYYLDLTAPGRNKGSFITALARRFAVPRAEIATIGDGDNDVAMFRESGLPIAMGNAADAVQRQAAAVTAGNNDDGFAAAVDRIILPRAAKEA